MSREPRRKHDEGASPVQFEYRNPKWIFWLFFLFTVCCLAIFFVLLALWLDSRIIDANFPIAYVFLGLAAVGAVFSFAGAYEKVILCDGVFRYDNPFGRRRTARVQDIAYVKLLTVYVHRGPWNESRKKQRVLFYGKQKQILIRYIDAGELSGNADFIKALRKCRIPIKREERHEG